MAKPFMSLLLQMLYKSCNCAHEQVLEYVGYYWSRALLKVLQNIGSQMCMLRVKTLSVWDHHSQIPRKKLWKAQQYKGACVSAVTGSVPHEMAKKVSVPCRNQTHVARLPVTCLNHWVMSLYWSLEEKLYMARVILGLLELNIKDRHDIPEFLTTNPLPTYVIALDIDWSWKLSLYLQVLLNSHQSAYQPQKCENWELEIEDRSSW